MGIDISASLQCLSSPVRMKIYRFLHDSDGKVPFNLILKHVYPNNDNEKNNKSATLSSHLKVMTEKGIIIKDPQGYYLTNIGKEMAENVLALDRIFSHYNKELMVRTSEFCLEPFNENKIVENLIREGGMSKKEAQKIANLTKTRILNANLNYLTTPLIREFVNVVLLENNYEDFRHKLTRLGLPPNDVINLLNRSEFPDIISFFNELGKNVFEQQMLLNLLPQGIGDNYLSGKLFFMHPDTWSLTATELILSGKKFSEVIIKRIQNKLDINNMTNKIEQFPVVLREIIDLFKTFFNSGMIITEFETALNVLSEYFAETLEKTFEKIINFLPKSNVYESYDPRNFHNTNWELWFEITLDEQDSKYYQELSTIFNLYFKDVEDYKSLILEEDAEIRLTNVLKKISEKPNILINIPPNIKEQIINFTNFDELPELLKKIIELSIYHNISFSSVSIQSKKEKNIKKVITPLLTPITIQIKEFANQNLISRPKIVLDKIFINLPRIIQISEDISDSPKLQDFKFSKDKTQFFNELKNWVFNAINIFGNKYKLFAQNIVKFKNWKILNDILFDRDLILDTSSELDEYNGSIDIICGISLNGIIECVRYFTGLYPDQEQLSFDFLIEIITFVSDLLRNNSKNSMVKYVLVQPHLDNYLYTRFIQDLNLIQTLSNEFLNTNNKEMNLEFEQIIKMRDPSEINNKNLNLTAFMNPQDMINSNKWVSPYWFSIYRTDSPKKISKIISYHQKFQQIFGDGAFLDLYIGEKISSYTLADLLYFFKELLKADIHNFGFTQILGNTKGIRYYRHVGCYKQIIYYERFLRNKLINRKDVLEKS